MSRIKEKVKDLIDVKPYESPTDFQADASQTLASYHFTSVTSELMAKWLDVIAEVNVQKGSAMALAGYRGVGKSHLLATIGALLAHPELRSRVTDSHVAASAQDLIRRRYPVAYVRRGTEKTLLDELKIGVSKALEKNIIEIPATVEEILSYAALHSPDVPFILIVDTAFERKERVDRDDGILLGKLAEISKDLNIFIGIALDDDITEADGINSAIARTYKIDYLDQEHLNKIVGTHIFPKHRQSQAILHQIYQHLRTILPAFRWSEERFTGLYPLHPSILEIAPFVRLYAPNFALLSFAAEAGQKILGRPADSLIGLDEVFDKVEPALRKSDDLREAFEVFDNIGKQVISFIPIMQRLQAKLILKALFILSLDGDGTTASEICSAMLIYDDNDPQKSSIIVEELLEKIYSVFPDEIKRRIGESKEPRFSLKVSSKDNLNNALTDAIANVDEDVIPAHLNRVAKERFSDWNISIGVGEELDIWTDCQTIWRGGFRRCRIYWNWENEAIGLLQVVENSDYSDVEIFINNANKESLDYPNTGETPRLIWQPAELSVEEKDTIKRFHLLMTDETLRDDFKEQVRAAGHTHSLAIEKIWKRVFLTDAKLLFENKEYSFTEIELNKPTFGEILSPNVKPFFEEIYPEHPTFNENLGMNEVSRLVNDLFSGARKTHQGIQELAEIYALPLGLVSKRGENYGLETEENTFHLPLVEKILALIAESGESAVSLKTVYKKLKERPYGLIREAQRLLLAALVAQRKIEFVTTNGDRINRRSLDLKIIWDDIAGIAQPTDVIYDTKKLTEWAKLLTEITDVETIDIADDRNRVRQSLKVWLEEWNEAGILEYFNDLPDEILTTKIWYISISSEKSFGSVAVAVQTYLDESITLEVCLQRIADAFSNSETEYKLRQDELITLVSFIRSAATRERIWNYLAICERTDDDEIEQNRAELFELLGISNVSSNSEINKRMERIWREFHTSFGEHFALKHDHVMKSHQLQEKFDEILKSDQWWEFENLSKLPVFHHKHWKQAQKIISRFGELDCRFDVRERLHSHPFCACSYNLSQMQDWEDLPKSLVSLVEAGRKSYRRTLMTILEPLTQMLENYTRTETDQELINAVTDLIVKIKNTDEIKNFSNEQLIILDGILKNIVSPPTVEVSYPNIQGLMTSSELSGNLNQWLEELPSETVFLDVR